MHESDDNEEAINHIPLKNLPYSGLSAFVMEPWGEDCPVAPDNVLIGHIGVFDRVAIVGRDAETGKLVYASSEDNIKRVTKDLRAFIEFLEEYEEMNG